MDIEKGPRVGSIPLCSTRKTQNSRRNFEILSPFGGRSNLCYSRSTRPQGNYNFLVVFLQSFSYWLARCFYTTRLKMYHFWPRNSGCHVFSMLSQLEVWKTRNIICCIISKCSMLVFYFSQIKTWCFTRVN